MRRREFIALIAGAAGAWPIATRAQTTAKLPIIGFLGATTPSKQTRWTNAFVRRLRELGWNDGQNVKIEYRWGEGRSEVYPEVASEFVRMKVDVIVVPGGATWAAKQATSAIPIVFTAASDPIGSGLVTRSAFPWLESYQAISASL